MQILEVQEPKPRLVNSMRENCTSSSDRGAIDDRPWEILQHQLDALRPHANQRDSSRSRQLYQLPGLLTYWLTIQSS